MEPVPLRLALLLFSFGTASLAGAQAVPSTQPMVPQLPGTGYRLIQPRTLPDLSPAVLLLLEQESRFQQAVKEGGGQAFGTFFADDAVVLSNGQPAVKGKINIAAQALWDPKQYQLTWQPEGAQMGPSGDTGFTWGHYDGRVLNATGTPDKTATTSSGRYITLWKKVDGTWKVALEASASEPAANPAAADACCTVPHP